MKRLFLLAFLLAACGQSTADQAEAQRPRPARVETAVFAGGCFWSAESDIEHVPGVVEAVSGYSGGRLANPTYEQVTTGRTGHLEAVRVTFDPARISYGQRRAAEAALAEANRILGGRVVTPVRAAAPFYPAEAYHQDYARRNALHYGLYRRGCGRDARLRAVWGEQAAAH